MKQIKISSGQSVIQLKLNRLGSFLQVKRPIAISWHDCQGSVAKYFSIMPFSKEYRELITEQINLLTQDSTTPEEDVIEKLSDFFNLLQNDTYDISYGKPWAEGVCDWELIYNTENKIVEDNSYLVAEGFYDFYFEAFIFTERYETINRDRVEYYKNNIREGKKPFAIILNGGFEEGGIHPDNSRWIMNITTDNYILDGHHKLLAYKELNLTPSILRITRLYSSRQCDFQLSDIEELKNWLTKGQIQHIIEHQESF